MHIFSVLAMFLSEFGMTAEEAHQELVKIHELVFIHSDNDREARSLRLESAVKDLMKRKGLPADTHFMKTDAEDPSCRVYAFLESIRWFLT
jgi:hypothetical protein